MPREEVRIRLVAANRIVPTKQLARLAKIRPQDLNRFINNVPPRECQGIGPERLKRLARICLDIETGALRYEGERRAGKPGKVITAEPTRSASPVHRVMFDGKTPALLQGATPKNDAMPSFANLFGGKPALLLPKISIKR